MEDYAVVINAVSSALKFCVYRRPDIGAWRFDTRGVIERTPTATRAAAALADWLRSAYEGKRILGVGHRVVYGGPRFTAPVLVTPLILDELHSLRSFAPREHGHILAVIAAMSHLLPGVPQIACFDTSFHRGRPDMYGCHGLSYEHIAAMLPQVAPSIADHRVLVAHLDDTSSVCALRNRKSIDVVPISGIGDNMRERVKVRTPSARRAIDEFVDHVGRDVGALAATSGGIDALVFTGEIGENHAEIRRRVCDAAAWLGIELDTDANRACALRISDDGSRVTAWIIPANAELVIARHTAMLLGLVETHA